MDLLFVFLSLLGLGIGWSLGEIFFKPKPRTRGVFTEDEIKEMLKEAGIKLNKKRDK